MSLGEAGTPRDRWVRRVVGFGIWTVLGLFEAVQSYCHYAAEGKSVSVPQALALGLLLWYGWAILWVFIVRLARRFPIEQQHWRGELVLHLVAGVVFALVKIVLDYPVIKFFYCPRPDLLTFPVFFRMALADQFQLYVLTYWAMVGVCHALNYQRKYRERELRASQLEAWLAQSQLQLLKAQLHPHFLFNTLNTISALMQTDLERADQMVARLGDLLRHSLDNFSVQEVPLWRELGFLDTYLEIEQVRFGPRLHIERNIDPDVLESLVPSLFLQPLVENALRHGIGPRPGTGHLILRAERRETGVHLEIEDDGVGLPSGYREGIGLANTRARLRQLYGDEHSLRLQPGDQGGVCVRVDLPFRDTVENGELVEHSDGVLA
jgi:two-component system LytT family sensor kinase